MGKKGKRASKKEKQTELETEIPEELKIELKESERIEGIAKRKGILTNEKPEISKQVLRVPKSVTDHCKGAPIKKMSKGRHKQAMLIFPGRFEPKKFGDKVGTIAKLNTHNPEFYIDFPKRGRLMFKGTLVYSTNKYITLQYPIGGGSTGVKCPGEVNTIVVFSEYFWLGTEEENPMRKPLPLPSWLAKPPNPEQWGDNTVGVNDEDEDSGEDEKQPTRRSGRSRKVISYKDLMPDDSDEDLQDETIEVSSSSEDELIFSNRQTVEFEDFET